MTEWKPDGIGLPDEALKLVKPNQPVHLRLAADDGSYPRRACRDPLRPGWGLGDWWTGVPDEVTCPDCLITPEAKSGCDCTELCSMGPTCPGGMLAQLPSFPAPGAGDPTPPSLPRVSGRTAVADERRSTCPFTGDVARALCAETCPRTVCTGKPERTES